MNDRAERHRRACELFGELVETDADVRASRLASLAAEDPELSREVAAMLAADSGAADTADDLMRAIDLAAEPFAAGADALLGTQIGRYRIDRLIAAGGMGRVYEARQDAPDRTVAIKLLDTRIISRSALSRFRHEAEVMARLVHPGIAQIYEAGTQREMQGTSPWFAMELVPNATTIIDAARDRQLDLRARIELFLNVCDAVHFGHGRGIIHRDLKPSNVLVDRESASLHPKIIDFGIARSTDSDTTLVTQRTEVGQIVGTLQYMSPEQLAGDPNAIDVRSDVYSLGLLLFELLTGQVAFNVSHLPLHEAMRVLTSMAPKRMRDAAPALRTIVTGDLQTIVSKAIERDVSRRYSSVAELAQDLRRYLGHQPISARPPSAGYTIRLFTRRHRAMVWGVVATLVMLVMGLIGTGVGFVRARWSEAAAEIARDQAEFDAYVANVMAAEAAMRTHDVKLARERLDAASIKHRGWEWRHLNGRLDRSVAKTTAELSTAQIVEFSPNGAEVAVGDPRGVVRIFDGITLKEIGSYRGPREVRDISFSADGTRLAVLFDPAEIHVVDAATQTLVRRHACDVQCRAEFLPGSDSIVIARVGGGRERWNVATDEIEELQRDAEPHLPPGQTDLTTASADGAWLVRGWPSDVRLVRAVDGELVSRFGVDHSPLHGSSDRSHACFSRDGRFLAVVLQSDRLVVRELATGIERASYLDAPGVTSLAWCPNEHAVILGDGRGVVTVYDASTLKPLRHLLGHQAPVSGLGSTGVGPNGPRLASVDWSGEVRLWSPDTSDLYRHTLIRSWVYAVAFAPDGSWFAASSGENPGGDPMVAAFDTRSGRQRWASAPSANPMVVSSVAVSGDGTIVAHDSQGASWVELRDAASGAVVSTVEPDGERFTWLKIVFRPRHREFMLTERTGRELYAVDDARRIRRFELNKLNENAMSPDGEVLAISPRPGTGIEIDRIDDGTKLATIATPSSVWSMAFSPDGRHLAARCEDGTLYLWSTSDWSLERTWEADGLGGDQIVFEPGGRLLGRVFGGIRIWDVERGRELLTLPVRGDPCSKPVVSANGEWLGVGCVDGSVLLFEAPPAEAAPSAPEAASALR